MTLLEIVVLVVIAAVCGALGQAIAGFSRGGFFVSVALGFVGAVIGSWIARSLGLPEILPVKIGDTVMPITWSIIGSALFVAIISFFSKKSAAKK
jgi:uncharacterized membrane protein YeaQ/YmgE (transglycosylase-associated protein family)